MTLQELINAVMLKATGKVTILAQGNAKWEKVKSVANAYLDTWQSEPKKYGTNWNSLYERARLIGTIGNPDEYPLPDDISEISTAKGDNICVETVGGKRVKYELVVYDDLRNRPYGKYCARLGKKLAFNKAFLPNDIEYGGEIFAPVYHRLEKLAGPDDEVLVDSPNWLVIMCAAEYIRNDIVKQNQYGNLVAEANDLMSSMLRVNRSGQVKKIRGSWRNPGGLC